MSVLNMLLPVPVLAVGDVMVPADSKDAMAAPHSTIESPKPHRLLWPRRMRPRVRRKLLHLSKVAKSAPGERVLFRHVKIVEPPSRHYGEGMKLGIPSAMLVVCSFSRCPYNSGYPQLTNARIGLYYKLHGTHRPSAMKKQEIKRRKRVVPANADGSTQAASSIAGYSPRQRATETPVFEHSASPDPAIAIESSETYAPTPEPRGPLAIDFTNYFASSTSASQSHGPSTPLMQPGAPSPRKRSRSATIDPEETASVPVNPIPHRPNAISSILNPTKSPEHNIDPSLSTISRPTASTSPGRSQTSPVLQEGKAARKDRLRREAEAMRKELARKERELQELDD